MRILLVDDQKDIIKDIGGFLEERGYQVALAFDGKAAMQSLEEGRYDLVVTDIRMPDVDGMTLLRWMKEKSPGTEVILITGYGSLDSAIEALRLGAYDYIRKPFDLAELFQAISNCLEKKGLEQKNERLIQELREHQTFLEQRVEEETQKSLEKERRLAKVEMLGQTMVTVAHYINNAMTAIIGNADFCQKLDDRRSEKHVQDLIQVCIKEGRRIEAVVESLKEVAERMDLKTVEYLKDSGMLMLDVKDLIERKVEALSKTE